MKAIPILYNGIQFRSKLEVKWAIFFDECGIKYTYEEKAYEYENQEDPNFKKEIRYCPDFIIHNVGGRVNGDLYVEVKGCMDGEDACKIKGFVREGRKSKTRYTDTPVLILGSFPFGRNLEAILHDMHREHDESQLSNRPLLFSFQTIDGDNVCAYPGINRNGHFEVFADDFASLKRMNRYATEMAYQSAVNALFHWKDEPVLKHCYRYADKYAKR